MPIFDQICYFFILFGGFLSWTIAIGMAFEDNKRTFHYVFGGLMFAAGAIQLYGGLLVMGKMDSYPALIFWHLPLLVMIGPLLLFSFKSANDESFRLSLDESLHFLAGFIIMILVMPLAALDAPLKLSFATRAPNISGENMFFRAYSGLYIAVVIILIVYIIYFFRECFFMLDIRLVKKKQLSPYLVIITAIMLPFMVVFFGNILAGGLFGCEELSYMTMIQVLTSLSFIFPLIFYILERKKINFFRLLNSEIKQRQYEVSIIRNLDVSSVLSRIQSLMEEEKIFCNEDLSVESLAERLSVKPYQLSRIINVNLSSNFNHLVNSYRIEESIRIFLEDSTRTVISVAFAVGFNSTTVFNKWFKRITGVSPKDFRDKPRN